MSNQCKNCDRDRDLNNNFVGYPSGYITNPANANNNNRNTTSAMTNNSASNNVAQGTQIKAKIMFGSVGAIKELREKEHAEKARSTQAGRRQ
jgi:hypothetical protein